MLTRRLTAALLLLSSACSQTPQNALNLYTSKDAERAVDGQGADLDAGAPLDAPAESTAPPEVRPTDDGRRPEDVADRLDAAAGDGTPEMTADQNPEDVCLPVCELKECGDDGCNGSCGKCLPPPCMTGWCSATGTCNYEPDLDGLVCEDEDPCTPPGECLDGECLIEIPEEQCGDEVDNDCDGLVDENCE